MLAFFREDDGQGLVEYALIIAVIAIAVIVAMIFLRGQLQNIFSNIGTSFDPGISESGNRASLGNQMASPADEFIVRMELTQVP
jgi:pilus assembly protein Flp/PilA